ncbi:MAG: ABC transporter ATP-binding protein [Candidatus Micrarchaeota archaeon]|nr:ABC transporter ATP-binding protein [Candidatus Micrarchaeota archaeon]
MPSELEARDVTFSYKGKQVLDGFAVDVRAGELVGLLGPSGCGKSTFLNICAGLDAAQSGSIAISGAAPGRGRRDIGYCTQYDSFYGELTVMENLAYFGTLWGMSRNRIADRAGILLDAAGLLDQQDLAAEKLSGGQKRRLNLVLSLLCGPKMLLVDEPTVGLDPTTRKSIWDLLLALKATGTAILFTTHYMFEAEALCDRVAIMDEGKVAAFGSVQALRDKYVPNELIRLSTLPAAEKTMQTLGDFLKKSGLAASVVREPQGLLVSARDPRKAIAAMQAFLKKTSENIQFVDVQEPSFNDVFFLATDRGHHEMAERI